MLPRSKKKSVKDFIHYIGKNQYNFGGKVLKGMRMLVDVQFFITTAPPPQKKKKYQKSF